MSKATDIKNLILFNEARIAGLEAMQKVTPEPMAVHDGAGKVWIVEGGPCGFASIRYDGRSSFGKWMKTRPEGRYGAAYHVFEGGQSYTRKTAYAAAFCRVQNANGVDATWESRLD